MTPSGTPLTWNTAQDERLVSLFLAGDTLQSIAEELGLQIDHVCNRIDALRAEGRDLAPRRPRWTEERRQLLARRRREGATLRDLEREFERSRGTITSQLRRLRDLGYETDLTAWVEW